MISRKTKTNRCRAQGGDVEATQRAHPSRITAQRQPRSEVKNRARNKAWPTYAPAVPQGGEKKLMAYPMDNQKASSPMPELHYTSYAPNSCSEKLIKWHCEYMTAMIPILSTKHQYRKGASVIGGAYCFCSTFKH